MATHGARGASGFSGYQGNQGRGSQNVRWHNGYQYVWSDDKQDFVRWVKVGYNNVPIRYRDAVAGLTEEQSIAKDPFQKWLKKREEARVKREAKETKKRGKLSRSQIKKDFENIWASEQKNQYRFNDTQVAGMLKYYGYDETQAAQLAKTYRAAHNDPPPGLRRDIWEYGPDYAFGLIVEKDHPWLTPNSLTKNEIKNAFLAFGYSEENAQWYAENKKDRAYCELYLHYIRNEPDELEIESLRRVHEQHPTSKAEAIKLFIEDFCSEREAVLMAGLYEKKYGPLLKGDSGSSGNAGTSGTSGTTGSSGNTGNIRQKGPNYALEQAFKQRPSSEAEVKKLFRSYGYSDSEADNLTSLYMQKWGGLITGGSGNAQTTTNQNQPADTASLFTSPLTEALKALPDLVTSAGAQEFEKKVKEILKQRTPEQIKEDEYNIKKYKRIYALYDEYSKKYKNDKAFAEEIRSVVFGDKSLPPEPQKRDRKWVDWRLKKMAVDYTQEAVKEAQNEGKKLSEDKALRLGLYKAERRHCSFVKDRFYTFEVPENRAIRQLLLPNSSPDSANRQFAKNCAWNVVNVDDHEIEFHLKKQAERAFDIIGQIADNIGVDLTQYPKLAQIKLTAISDADYDGKYYPSSNTVEMTLRGLDKNTKLDTMVHELAHAVEFAVPGLRLTAALFRDEISDGTVVAHTNDDDKDNIYGSTIEVPDQYSMREYKATDEQSEIFSVFAQYLTSNPQDACIRSREFYERFAKALDRRNRLNAMVSAGTVTPDEKNFVHEYENKLDAALSRNNIKVALSLYEQWLRDQRLLLDLTKGGDSNTRLERQKTYNRLRTQIEEMFRSNESRPGQKLLKQIERLINENA